MDASGGGGAGAGGWRAEASGREVNARALLGTLDAARACGAEPAALIAGLPFTLADLRVRGARVSWDHFLVAWARIEDHLGGVAGFERLADGLFQASATMKVLGRLFLDPRHLYLHLAPRMSRWGYSHIRSATALLPDGRVVYEHRIADGYSIPASFNAATQAMLRAYPRVLGLPDAQVEAAYDAAGGRFVMRPPGSRTLASTLHRALAALPSPPPEAAEDFELAGPEDLPGFLSPAPTDRLSVLGSSLLAHQDLAGLFEGLRAILAEQFLCRSVSLWVAGGAGGLQLAGAAAPEARAATRSLALELGGRTIGRLDVDGALFHQGAASLEELEGLLPWLAMAVARLAGGAEAPDGVAAVARTHRLTPREAEVLRWLREGKTNGEIAAILGISARTVHKHVEHVLEKLGAETRQAAARRTFS